MSRFTMEIVTGFEFSLLPVGGEVGVSVSPRISHWVPFHSATPYPELSTNDPATQTLEPSMTIPKVRAKGKLPSTCQRAQFVPSHFMKGGASPLRPMYTS